MEKLLELLGAPRVAVDGDPAVTLGDRGLIRRVENILQPTLARIRDEFGEIEDGDPVIAPYSEAWLGL